MRITRSGWLAIAVATLALPASAAETKLQVTGAHLCCGGCFNGVTSALRAVRGADATIDKQTKTIAVAARDKATAQKAIDAIAAAGFHGKVAGAEVAFKDDSGAPAGRAAKLEVAGAHNCCGKCSAALTRAAKSVAGVLGHDIQTGAKSFTVTGNFSAAQLVKAINAAGFHVKVK